ncbi:MAG: DUF5668 domain-containing protein [Patescibacteria group bacterium]|nr:DUF5668 domain-containing protein [Patescibacteria group bacterium]
MAWPIIIIIFGVFALFYNSGWTTDFSLNIQFLWPMFVILVGLIIALKRRDE